MTTDLDDLAQFDDLRVLMTDALADLDVPTARLRDRATIAGGRLRRRRHALVAAGGLAAAATVAAFALPVVGGSASSAKDGGYAVQPTVAPSAVADLPQPFVPKPGYWDMPVADMAARLSHLLPKRVGLAAYEKKSTDRAPGESDAYIGYLTGTLTGATGPGGVNVMLTQLSDQAVLDAAKTAGHAWGDLDFGCPPDVAPEVEVRSCSTASDASGSVVQRELETVADGVTYREVRIVTHGGTVYAATANSTQRKWTAPPSASRNPLTMDQLARIATAAVWTDWTPPAS